LIFLGKAEPTCSGSAFCMYPVRIKLLLFFNNIKDFPRSHDRGWKEKNDGEKNLKDKKK
jgi:hypothetical protein